MNSNHSYKRYYPTPFGSVMLGRDFSGGKCKYGMNGQEKVDEISGSGNHYNAMFWEYDPRLSRRWNVDPVDKPWESSYACFWNNPIRVIDPNGDDGYVDEDGNHLGDDGDKKSHETRVITADKWKEIVGDAKDISKNMRKQLQTNITEDENGDVTGGSSKLLQHYEKGINISGATWKKLEDKGGKRLTPFVTNNTDGYVFYKPEGWIDGVNVNPYAHSNLAYEIEPGTSLYSPVDGVATKKHADKVFKIGTSGTAVISKSGNVITTYPILNFGVFIEGWKDKSWLKVQYDNGDDSWNPLFRAATNFKKY